MDIKDFNELNKVEKTIKTFFEGLDQLNHERIYEVLHPNAKSYMYSKDGRLYVKNAKRWKNYCINIKKSLKDPNNRKVSGYIEKIDLEENSAMVKALLKIEFPTGVIDFVDFFQLMKIRDKWMIVSNAYHGELIKT